MTIYDDLRMIAQDVLGEFPQGTVNLIQVTAGDGDIDDPGDSEETTTALDAVVTGVSFEFVRDGLAVATDLIVTAAPVDGLTVSEKDIIEIDSVRHKITQDLSKPSAGTKVVWKFIVRKGA